MAPLFCCSKIEPYRPQILAHEPKFRAFTQWAAYPREAATEPPNEEGSKLANLGHPYVIQMVRQVNFGPLESKRYFASSNGVDEQHTFLEVTEPDLIEANYQKLNAYKNFRCSDHNKFFELNVYEKDPVNKHHWRYNIARPGNEIDL